MSFRYLQGHFFQTTTEPSTFLTIPQLGPAAREDLVANLMVTAEVGPPDAV